MSLEGMLRFVKASLGSRTAKTVFYANSYAVKLAESDAAFAAAMGKADAIFCDGFGVYVASRVLGGAIPERFAWPDWIERLGAVCRDNGASMFFLGAKDGVAAEAARKLESAIPGLRVSSHHGHFQKDDLSSREVIDRVNLSGAGVLLVGFGMPLQEAWITQHRERLNPTIVFSVGAMFDYVAGNAVRGPRWLTQHGFEWLTRLVVEPRRLWRRYLLGLPEFALLVGRQWMNTRPNVRMEK
ncbi:MAG TPA: WecB/TagA/CpsF family glycosyltransferase [Gemmatimonadaceae bacterium]|nr:WecB/TagA/CpsF family glycosyltransferase [Gemmatimonadaceae bacterium]